MLPYQASKIQNWNKNRSWITPKINPDNLKRGQKREGRYEFVPWLTQKKSSELLDTVEVPETTRNPVGKRHKKSVKLHSIMII